MTGPRMLSPNERSAILDQQLMVIASQGGRVETRTARRLGCGCDWPTRESCSPSPAVAISLHVVGAGVADHECCRRGVAPPEQRQGEGRTFIEDPATTWLAGRRRTCKFTEGFLSRRRRGRHDRAMGYRMDQSDGTSRRVIDLAVGVLVGLRGCSPEEAFAELVEVVRQKRVGIGTIATELVALAGGATSTNDAQDLSAWADLIRQRRTDPMAAAR